MVLLDSSKRTVPFATSACIIEQVVELLCEKNGFGTTSLCTAISDGTLGMCEIILRRVEDYLGHTKVRRYCTTWMLLTLIVYSPTIIIIILV